MEGGPVRLPTVHVETHLFMLHHQLRHTSHFVSNGYTELPTRRLASLASSRSRGAGSYGEAGPLLRHVGDAEGSSFVAVGRLLSIRVVEQDALEAPPRRGQDQTQLHHLLMGISDGKQDPPPLGGRTHLRQQQAQINTCVNMSVSATCTSMWWIWSGAQWVWTMHW